MWIVGCGLLVACCLIAYCAHADRVYVHITRTAPAPLLLAALTATTAPAFVALLCIALFDLVAQIAHYRG